MWNKYQQQKKQVTTDGGLTWNDVIPYEYRQGSLIESNSADCTPETPDCEIQYKWVDVDTSEETMCWDGNEWSIQKKYYSRDCGDTWIYSGVKQTYQMVTPNSECCDGDVYICGDTPTVFLTIPQLSSLPSNIDTFMSDNCSTIDNYFVNNVESVTVDGVTFTTIYSDVTYLWRAGTYAIRTYNRFAIFNINSNYVGKGIGCIEHVNYLYANDTFSSGVFSEDVSFNCLIGEAYLTLDWFCILEDSTQTIGDLHLRPKPCNNKKVSPKSTSSGQRAFSDCYANSITDSSLRKVNMIYIDDGMWYACFYSYRYSGTEITSIIEPLAFGENFSEWQAREYYALSKKVRNCNVEEEVTRLTYNNNATSQTTQYTYRINVQ